MLTFNAPETGLRGEQLREELERAGYQGVRVTELRNDLGAAVLVEGFTATGNPVDDRSRPKIEGLLRAHTPAAPLPTHARRNLEDARLRQLQAKGFRNLSASEREDALELMLARLRVA